MDGGIRMAEERDELSFFMISTQFQARPHRPGFLAQFTGQIAHPLGSF
jgi:hypothetical protein